MGLDSFNAIDFSQYTLAKRYAIIRSTIRYITGKNKWIIF